MDYYDLMVLSQRFRNAALTTVIAGVSLMGWAQPQDAAQAEDASPVASNPALDAELFYELFLAEVSSLSGDPGAGYALMMEAARRTGDGQLYHRAADIALQSRSGEYALAAANAWKQAEPGSREANRYVLQILIALNRIGETPALLRQELAQSSARARASTLAALPQMYGRASDKALAARVVSEALSDEFGNPATGPIAWISVGRLKLAAGDKAGALDAARKSQTLDADNEGTVRLALELMEENTPGAEPLVAAALSRQPSAELRLAYARVLLGLQRVKDAESQLETVTRGKPDLAEPWLVLASLQFQDNRFETAQASLQRYIELAGRGDAPARERGLTQAYLLLAQIAEKKQDYAAAESWLQRIGNADDLMAAQSRRASLLARQGKLEEARALLHNLPGTTPENRRLKLLAEVQLLRDMKLYQAAYEVQQQAVALMPEETELVYDQAMLAEKAGKPEVMEQLLRQLIERQPQYHHAYNALGYSLAERGVRLDEAKQLISKALELAPGDPFITDSLGWVEFRMGNLAEARKQLEAAYKTRPDVEIAAHLGEVMWVMGERDNARKIWREGLRVGPDNETLNDTLKRLGVTL
jgi:tetratricopeptide (TPR) repeat protein